MNRFISLGMALLFTSATSYSDMSLSKANGMDICPMHASPNVSPGDKAEGAQVGMVHDHQTMMISKGAIADQEQQPDPNPPQPGDTYTHRKSPGDGCSSVDPNAKPDTEFKGVKSNTVGCGCAPRCENGQRVEDRSMDKNERYICKNACYTDRCFCPDPCKS